MPSEYATSPIVIPAVIDEDFGNFELNPTENHVDPLESNNNLI